MADYEAFCILAGLCPVQPRPLEPGLAESAASGLCGAEEGFSPIRPIGASIGIKRFSPSVHW
jgi:hypothetical protein